MIISFKREKVKRMTAGRRQRRGAGAVIQLQPLKAREKGRSAIRMAVSGSLKKAGWMLQRELTSSRLLASSEGQRRGAVCSSNRHVHCTHRASQL